MVDDMVDVDPSNAAQAAAWDGGEGDYWAARADRFDRSIAAHHGPFMEAARLDAGEEVLDVGCGAGETACDAGRMVGSGGVLGVDLSSALLDVARRRAGEAGLTNVSFLRADAQAHPFAAASFDVAIGRTSAMFFGDHRAGLQNLRRALRRPGRLALLTWQPLDRNEWLREIARALAAGREPRLPPPGAGPFSLSEPDRVRALLGDAGFTDVDLDGIDAPMWFGHDADDAHDFILGLSGWMLEGLDEDGRRRASDALHATIVDHQGTDGVTFSSATWVVTARTADRDP